MKKWIIQGNDPILDFAEMYYCESGTYTVDIDLALRYYIKPLALLRCLTLNRDDPTVNFKVRQLTDIELELIKK